MINSLLQRVHMNHMTWVLQSRLHHYTPDQLQDPEWLAFILAIFDVKVRRFLPKSMQYMFTAEDIEHLFYRKLGYSRDISGSVANHYHNRQDIRTLTDFFYL